VGDTETWPKIIESYQTSDRELFTSRAVAEHHQERLDGAALATKMLDEGKSLGESLRAARFLPEGVLPELDEVTKDTKLVIEHWQCRSQPGYSPRAVRHTGEIWTFGDAGSWSGPWGSHCSPTDIANYWLDTKRRAEVRRG